MARDERRVVAISRWLEETAPTRLPERVLDATFERTRKSRQQVGWRAVIGRLRITRFEVLLSGTAVVALAAAVALSYYAIPASVGGPAGPFVGTWEATDPPPDRSHLTMAVIALPDGTYDVTIRDDIASVCSGASSTMTGVAVEREPRTFVIAQPDYVCDDGSEPQALSGPPLLEQLRNLTFIYHRERDELRDPAGLVWSRAPVEP